MWTIVSALKSEIQPFLEYYSITNKISIGSASLYKSQFGHFFRTGIGSELAAENLALYLKEYMPDRILNLGLAGSLNPEIKVGQIFNIHQIIDEMTSEKLDLPAFGPVKSIVNARLVTVRKAVNDIKKRHDIKIKYNADLVDMEAYQLAKISAAASIPFHSYKIVSDQADQDAEKMFMNNYKKLCFRLFDNINPLLQIEIS